MDRKLLFIRLSLVAVSVGILAGSSVPGHKIPAAFSLTPDKLIHCVEYFVLGIVLYRWLKEEFEIKTTFLLILTVIIGSVWGILDENYQRLIPGRNSDFWDWVLDTIGVSIAAVSSYYFGSGISSHKKRLSHN
jgi:VanZ family protein